MKLVADELRKAGFEINKDDFTFIQAKSGVIVDMKAIRMSVEKDNLEYLNQKHKPLPKEVIEILLKWIPKVSYEPVQEVLVRQLSKTKDNYNGNILLEIFKKPNFVYCGRGLGLSLRNRGQ